jgi:hypothetical protein
MRSIIALLLSCSLACAQGVQTYTNFFLQQRLPDVIVNGASQNVSLGSNVPTLARLCNRGPEDIYVLGGSATTVVTPATGVLIPSGTCGNVSAVDFTNLALISDGNLGTLVTIELGVGNP